MKKFRWSEVFYSIQGEGARVGKPSVFIRLFGCNLKCQGFGLDAVPKHPRYLNVQPDQVESFKDLPLVGTGCDSYASWDPRCKHLMSTGSADDLIIEVKKALKIGTEGVVQNWLNGIDVVITGGEPLLGWQKLYPELLIKLVDLGVEKITFETNGTKQLEPSFRKYLDSHYFIESRIIWSISPKLSNSGEPKEKTIKPAAIGSLLSVVLSQPYFKFVVRDGMESEIKSTLMELYSNHLRVIPVYVMAEGGLRREYDSNSRDICEMALRNRWSYSPRLQLDLFNNSWGT